MALDPFYLSPEWVTPLADAIERAMLDTWAGETERLIAADPRDTSHIRESYDLETQVRVRQQAEGLARGRLQQYGERLTAFLDTQPAEADIADWLSARALTDAGVWARGDALETRRDARLDYYRTNRAPEGRWTILPEGASEPACMDVAGQTYGSYDEAESALGGAWHRNCQHYVDMAGE